MFYNSNYGGQVQVIAAGEKANLDPGLKNDNASHQFGNDSAEMVPTQPSPNGSSVVPRGNTPGSLRRPSSVRAQEMIEHPRREPQALHRHALVDAVEERPEVEPGWQQHRVETEALNP